MTSKKLWYPFHDDETRVFEHNAEAYGKWLAIKFNFYEEISSFMMRLCKQFTSTVNTSLDENDKAEVIANV